MDGMLGRVLGHYELVARLGGGGMGTVYRGMHQALQQPRAVKILRPDLADEPDVVTRFRREAMIAAGLRHPNVVLIYDVAEEDGVHYIVMDLLAGVSLRSIIRSEAPLPIERVARLLRPLASALDFAHGQGIYHRDIKPDNVMVGANDHVTLVDFGIARAADEARVTRTGTVVGTVAYMAPEAFTSAGSELSGDLYALGVIAYELLTGQTPFHGNPTAVGYAQVNTPPPLARSLNATLSPGVERALHRQLSKNPADRFPDAMSFVETLVAPDVPADERDAPTIAVPESWTPPAPPRVPTPTPPRDMPLPPPAAGAPERGAVAQATAPRERSATVRLAAFVLVVLAIVVGGSIAIWSSTAAPAAVAQATATPSSAATKPASVPATTAPSTLAPTTAPAAPTTAPIAAVPPAAQPPAPAATAAATVAPAAPVATPPATAGAAAAVPPAPAPTQAPPPPTSAAASPAVAAAAGAPPPSAPAFQTVVDERFADNQRTWPSNPASTAWVADGVYHLSAKDPGRFVSVGAPGLGTFGDVEVVGRFHKVGGPPGGGFGLIVRDQGPGPRDGLDQGGRYYVLEVGEGTQYGIWRRETDHWVDIIPFTPSDAVRPPPETNELQVRAVGSRLTFTVNGVEIASVEDAALPNGAVGIYVAGDGNVVEAEQFTVRALR